MDIMEIKEIVPMSSILIELNLIELQDFIYMKNLFTYLEKMKERNIFFIQKGYCIKSLTQNKCTDDGLP